MPTFNRKAIALLIAVISTQTTALAEQTLAEIIATDQRDAQIERKNAPLQKIVIAEEEVERYGDATVGDVLRRLPGMSFTGPAGVTKDIRMRGLDKGYTQFLVNGEPVPGAVQERQMQVDRLPADMIERIEIIRNPTAEYDASGIGGTINIVFKNRTEDITRLRAAYGKNGSLDVGDVIGQWSRRFDDLDVVLAVSHTVGAEDTVEDKNTFNAAGALTQREHKPHPVKKTETLITPRLSLRLGDDRVIIEPFVSSGTEDKRETSEVRLPTGALSKSTTNNEDKIDFMGRLGGRYEGKTSWGSWYAKAAVQQGRSDKDKYATESNGLNVITKRTKELEKVQEDQAYLGAGIALPLGTHLVKAGVEQRQTEYEKNKTVREASNATNPLLPKAAGANDIYNIKEGKSVVYLQDEWQLAKSHWLTPGLRYERTARDATDRNGVTRANVQNAANPSAHYRWAALDDLNVRASIARTLKLPKFDDVNPLVTLATGANTSSNVDKGGNADLKPEVARGIELGMENFFAGNRGVLGLNFYHRNVQDFVQKMTVTEGGRFVERPYNVGEARFWGAELDWRVPLLDKGTHQLSLIGSHAELRGRLLNSKTGSFGEVKDLPPRITNIGIDWKHAPSQWTGGFAVNLTPAFSTDALNGDGVREVKSRNIAKLFDFYIGKTFSPLAELRLIAKNVLAINKEETTVKYNTNGTIASTEAKIETSRPTIFLTFESRF